MLAGIVNYGDVGRELLPAVSSFSSMVAVDTGSTPDGWLFEPIGNNPPAEAEARYYAQLRNATIAA